MPKRVPKIFSKSLDHRFFSSLTKTTEVQNIIIKELSDNADPLKKTQIEKYMKHTTKYRGLNAPQITMIFRKTWEHNIKNLKLLSEKKELAENLLKSPYGEDKIISMNIYGKIFKEIDETYMETIIKQFFIEKHIVDWAMCDSFCSKFLKQWSLLSKNNSILLSKWRNEENIWLKRASCVTFVTRAKHGDKKPNFEGFVIFFLGSFLKNKIKIGFTEMLFEICGEVIKCQERFAQLGCGWLLREISLVDKEKVKIFIEENLEKFSKEGLRYAVEKMNEKEAKKIQENHKKRIKE